MSTTINQHANGLIHETSPYLLQHAHNPVDWYPWGAEAFEKARRESKPIFLSIGYSACHWCHVMERESFEKPDIAAYLNKHFVSIKVDREERPDVDEIYMTAVQMMAGSGGWPLSVFLTPDLKPFYGGTYFPPEDRWGAPGFPTILRAVVDAREKRPGEIAKVVESLHGALKAERGQKKGTETAEIPGREMIDKAIDGLSRMFDDTCGGFGKAPKFPQPSAISLLLRHHERTKNENSLEMAESALDHMARGGMYDHLGGGFHRYSVDAQWLVPHFEKMLYDNAQLASVYLEAWRLTGNKEYARTAGETLDYVLRDMTSPESAFTSAQDADSEGEEGKYYVWSRDEIRRILGDEDAAIIEKAYGVTAQGNFEGRNILFLPQPLSAMTEDLKMNLEALRARLAAMKSKLLAVRQQRIPPLRDKKVLTDWNALMISALCEGARSLNEPRYAAAAQKAGRFLLDKLRRGDGRLFHVYGQGRAKVDAFLTDYAYTIAALIGLYETDFDPSWIEAADSLAQLMRKDFEDARGGGFYMTAEGQSDLIVRPKRWYDGSTPSGNAVAALALLRLAELNGDDEYRAAAERTLRAGAGQLRAVPAGHLALALTADTYGAPRRQIAIVGRREDRETQALIDAVRRRFLPNTVVAFRDPFAPEKKNGLLRLLEDRVAIDGRATAYVCEDFACKLPVHTPEALAAQLAGPQ